MSLRLIIILTVLISPSLPCGVMKYDDAMFIFCRRFFKVCQTNAYVLVMTYIFTFSASASGYRCILFNNSSILYSKNVLFVCR